MANLRGFVIKAGQRTKQSRKQTAAPRLHPVKMSIRSHRLTRIMHEDVSILHLSGWKSCLRLMRVNRWKRRNFTHVTRARSSRPGNQRNRSWSRAPVAKQEKWRRMIVWVKHAVWEKRIKNTYVQRSFPLLLALRLRAKVPRAHE